MMLAILNAVYGAYYRMMWSGRVRRLNRRMDGSFTSFDL